MSIFQNFFPKKPDGLFVFLLMRNTSVKNLTRKVSKKEEHVPKPVKKIKEPEPVKKQEEDEEIENVIEYQEISSVSTFFPDIAFEAISTFLTEEQFSEDPIKLNEELGVKD